MCMGYVQISMLCHLYKGLEHPWISVFLVGPGTSPLYMDAKGWLYLSVFFFFLPLPTEEPVFTPGWGNDITPIENI